MDTNWIAFYETVTPEKKEYFRITSAGDLILGEAWNKNAALRAFWDSFQFAGKSLVQRCDEATERAEAAEAALHRARLEVSEDDDADSRVSDRWIDCRS